MADEPDSLVLRYLRRIDERMERIEVRLDQITHRMRVQEETSATFAHAIAAMSGRLDDMDARLGRIERRRDLASA